MTNPQLLSYSMVKTESTSCKIRNETRLFTLATFIQNSLGSPSHGNHRRKKNGGIQTGKENIKLSLFEDDMILYTENSKDDTTKLLELIDEFGKVAGYKIFRNLLQYKIKFKKMNQ